ncbi:hypothetical protein Bpfe_024796 [Biomphalaria pfeifferi]|uniref:Uncharacterized protein n=1 Tax=Biomphalaria pfeifferi TaxID=112525 RepID=A0AAD8EZ20_BIOPF|nr:hypothetical protein Bpfe_024796 [Biomphalaria pfeifferi]
MCIPNINYIDANAETMLPDVTERSISCYLGQFNAQISKTAKLLNDERYIEYLKHGHSESYVFFKAAIFVQMKKAKYLADLKMDTNGIIS